MLQFALFFVSLTVFMSCLSWCKQAERNPKTLFSHLLLPTMHFCWRKYNRSMFYCFHTFQTTTSPRILICRNTLRRRMYDYLALEFPLLILHSLVNTSPNQPFSVESRISAFCPVRLLQRKWTHRTNVSDGLTSTPRRSWPVRVWALQAETCMLANWEPSTLTGARYQHIIQVNFSIY